MNKRRGESLSAFFQMEFVQKPVRDRRKRDANYNDHRQSAVQCVGAGKDLSTWRLRLFERPHATQQH